MRFLFWRSKAFWLGLPGLVFLGWGWWHSMGHYSKLNFGMPHGPVLFHERGELCAIWRDPGYTDRFRIEESDTMMADYRGSYLLAQKEFPGTHGDKVIHHIPTHPPTKKTGEPFGSPVLESGIRI